MKYFTLFLCSLLSPFTFCQTLTLAVAGGFKPAMEQIKPLFERQTGHELKISYASVGSLYAQIEQGAPFDIMLSADDRVPKKLEQSGLGIQGSRFTYAYSQLVLWSPDVTLVDQQGEVLRQARFNHLALPNPKVGVHGAAAIDVLKKMGIRKQTEPKWVEGKNVLQTYLHIQSGSAELGFIGWSLIYRKGKPVSGSYWKVPEDLHKPIPFQAISLKQAAEKRSAATQFLSWLKSNEANHESLWVSVADLNLKLLACLFQPLSQ